MMKKVALPIIKNHLSPDFERSSVFIIYTIENNKSVKGDLLYTQLQSGLFPYWLAKKGVTDIIAKGISINSISKLNQFKINVFAGVNSLDTELLLKEFLNGTLETNGALIDNE
jgi:predicted Fe-Mo cluster-binding NifX family protein